MKEKRGFPFFKESFNNQLIETEPSEDFESNFINEYINFLNNPKSIQILPFLKKLQTRISNHTFPLEKLLEKECFTIKFLLDLIKYENIEMLQFYACWIFATLLVSEDFQFDKLLYENGFFKIIMNSLISKPNLPTENNDLYIQMLWVLGNFFGSENISFEEIHSEFNTICKLILQKCSKDNIVMSIWTIGNILKGEILLPESQFVDILMILVDVLYTFSDEDESISIDIYSIVSKYASK